MKNLYITIVLLFSVLQTAGQQIISVTPNQVSLNREATVLVTTTGVFLQPTASIDFGAGITVKNKEVLQNKSIRAQIEVSAGVATGTRTITLINDGTTLTYDFFEVVAPGAGVTAFIEVIPVQKIYLTDLNPNDPLSSPLLFNVVVNNDNQVRTLTAKLSLTGEKTGLWATANKNLSSLQPNTVTQFNNKEFDTYNVNTSNSARLQEAAQQGVLPTDIYEYKIEIFEAGTKVTETTGKNIVDNPIARPELIGPGSAMNLQPEEVNTPTPFFQWFSQAASHTISVYPVFNGQTTREEITLNRPVWTQSNIAAKNILYPISAELLEEGQTYAWQIVGIINGAKGDEKIFSNVYWFSYKKTDLKQTQYARLLIEPDQPTVKTNTSLKFSVYGFDENNKRFDITDKVQWKVLSSNFGSISRGNFVAGAYPENIAVVAQYGSQQVFADVKIIVNPEGGGFGWDMGVFLKKVFGMP